MSYSSEAAPPVRVLVYSDDRNTRERVRQAVGRRPDPELGEVEYVECATEHALLKNVDRRTGGGFTLLILDGEAVPAGGMGMCRQLKDEIFQCPPILVLTGRPQDAWLAAWSRADAAVSHPLEPTTVARAVVRLARQRLDSTLTPAG